MGDQYLGAEPMRLLRLKADKTPVVAALVPEGTPAPAPDEIGSSGAGHAALNNAFSVSQDFTGARL